MSSRLHKASNRLHAVLFDPLGKLRHSNPVEAEKALANEYQLCCLDKGIGKEAALSALIENYVIATCRQQGGSE